MMDSELPDSRPQTREEIEAELAETREHLAQTVDALHHKLDVKSRASSRITELRERHGRTLIAAGAAFAVAVVVTYVIRRET